MGVSEKQNENFHFGVEYPFKSKDNVLIKRVTFNQ